MASWRRWPRCTGSRCRRPPRRPPGRPPQAGPPDRWWAPAPPQPPRFSRSHASTVSTQRPRVALCARLPQHAYAYAHVNAKAQALYVRLVRASDHWPVGATPQLLMAALYRLFVRQPGTSGQRRPLAVWLCSSSHSRCSAAGLPGALEAPLLKSGPAHPERGASRNAWTSAPDRRIAPAADGPTTLPALYSAPAVVGRMHAPTAGAVATAGAACHAPHTVPRGARVPPGDADKWLGVLLGPAMESVESCITNTSAPSLAPPIAPASGPSPAPGSALPTPPPL